MKGNYTAMFNSYIHIHLKLSELLEGRGNMRLHLLHVFLLKFEVFFVQSTITAILSALPAYL